MDEKYTEAELATAESLGIPIEKVRELLDEYLKHSARLAQERLSRRLTNG